MKESSLLSFTLLLVSSTTFADEICSVPITHTPRSYEGPLVPVVGQDEADDSKSFAEPHVIRQDAAPDPRLLVAGLPRHHPGQGLALVREQLGAHCAAGLCLARMVESEV